MSTQHVGVSIGKLELELSKRETIEDDPILVAEVDAAEKRKGKNIATANSKRHDDEDDDSGTEQDICDTYESIEYGSSEDI